MIPQGMTAFSTDNVVRFSSGSDTVLFDPVSLDSVFLSDTEVELLDHADPGFMAELESLLPPTSRPAGASIAQRVRARLAELDITGEVDHVTGYRIVVTDKCNMTCSYCFVDTNTGKNDMTESDLIRGLDYLLETNRDRELVTLQWFGGEPTIRFDLMQLGDRYVHGRKEEFGIGTVRSLAVTNAARITDAMVEHFVEFNYSVGVSIDGRPEVNTERTLLSGKPADPRIHANIRRMIEAGVPVAANLTPTAFNARNMVEVIDYIVSLGITFIYVNTPIPISGRWHVPGAVLAESLFKARLHAIGRGAMVFSSLDRIYQAIDTRRPRVYEHMQQDGGVRVALLPGGRISVLDLNWRDDRFIHTIDEIERDPGLLNLSRKALHPSPKCDGCPAAGICGGPSQNDRSLRSTDEPDDEFCSFFRTGLRLALTDGTGLQ